MADRCDLFVPINRETQPFDLWHYVQCDRRIHHEGKLCRAARLINNAVVQVETCGLPEGSY